jgi:hypothetical protein
MATETKKAPVRAKRTIKTPAAKVAAAPKKEATNAHLDAGIAVNRYTGPSSFVNANRKPQIRLGVEAVADKITDRQKAGLYALRDCYGNKQFKPRGFDNGILSMLAGAGLLKVEGGQKATINGATYQVDGDKPVVLTITAAGMTYGKA